MVRIKGCRYLSKTLILASCHPRVESGTTPLPLLIGVKVLTGLKLEVFRISVYRQGLLLCPVGVLVCP